MKKITTIFIIQLAALLQLSAQNFSLANQSSNSLVNLNTNINTTIETTKVTLDAERTNFILYSKFPEEQNAFDMSESYGFNKKNSTKSQRKAEKRIRANLSSLNITQINDSTYVQTNEKVISSDTIDNTPKLQVETFTKSKTISCLTQSTFEYNDKDHIIAIGASVSGENDFNNIFQNGNISSNGSLNFTYGFGEFAKEKKKEKKEKEEKEESDEEEDEDEEEEEDEDEDDEDDYSKKR